MFAWIIKMLLKIMKPFAKIAILEALLGSLSGDEETEGEAAGTEDTEGTVAG